MGQTPLTMSEARAILAVEGFVDFTDEVSRDPELIEAWKCLVKSARERIEAFNRKFNVET